MIIISLIINLYIFVLILDVIFSYFPQFQRQPWRIYLRRAGDITCGPLRQLMPSGLPVDFTPLIVIFLLKAIESLLLGL